MINPSTYSEDAWKQWHSSRVDRLSASEGWLSLVGLDFLPTALGQTLSFGGPDADLSPEGFPAKRLGQFVPGQEGWRFHAAKHVSHAPSMARRLMRACCRPMLMADRPS